MGRKGVTFIEILISMLILGIAVGVMLSGFIIGRFSSEKARHHSQALNYARAAMEELIEDPTASIDPNVSELNGTCSSVVSSYASGVNQLTVTVSWPERSMGLTSTASVQLTTLINE